MAATEPPSGPLLRVERSDRDGIPHIEVIGELDLATIDPLKLRLELVEREDPPAIVVNLSRVSFMDSMGLGILLSHHIRAKQAGRRLVLVAGPPEVQAVFSVTGMLDQFEWAEGQAGPPA